MSSSPNIVPMSKVLILVLTRLYTVSVVTSWITIILLDQSCVFVNSLSLHGELQTVDATELWYEKAKLYRMQTEGGKSSQGLLKIYLK